jgi:hypothetical protein
VTGSGRRRQQLACAALERRDDRAVGAAVEAQLAERLVAREDHEERQRVRRGDPRAQPAVAREPPRQARHLAPPVGALAPDELPRRGIDRGDAVELGEDRVLRGPEAHAAGDRPGHRRVGIGEVDGLPDTQERGALVEALADPVDEVQPRAEVLVERRARDPGAVGDLLDRRLVEGALGHERGDRVGDLAARRGGSLRAAPVAVRAGWHGRRV